MGGTSVRRKNRIGKSKQATWSLELDAASNYDINLPFSTTFDDIFASSYYNEDLLYKYNTYCILIIIV